MRYGGLISDLVQEEEKTSMFGNILSFKSPDTVLSTCSLNIVTGTTFSFLLGKYHLQGRKIVSSFQIKQLPSFLHC